VTFLDFEQPIAELEEKIEELQRVGQGSAVDLNDEIGRLRARSAELTESIFRSLSPWQLSRLARHPARPYTLDYLARIVDDFVELHGDRQFADDPAIVAGLGSIEGRRVAIVGHQKGRTTRENLNRNFGMPRPEGYRKALRVFRLAERFNLPILTFIDTPGAYPGIDAEERGQSEAIAQNLQVMAELQTPIIATVIGEGGSGGALAIGVCDRLLMLQYSIYSVISPEGCASILWKSAEKAPEAAAALGLTVDRLNEFGLVDVIVNEPPGGAHRNVDEMCERLKRQLIAQIDHFIDQGPSELIDRRMQRLLAQGRFQRRD
jgi:acetyl-CoA carboxylase carboxyl transferase subunit alpha